MNQFHTLFISALLLISATYTYSLKSCNCVAFRLDDIQVGWIEAAQIAVQDVFKENKDPLSVGIIANVFGGNNQIVNYVKTATQISDWDYEVVSHGFVHERFDQKPLLNQTYELAQSKSKTMQVLDGYIDTFNVFIPPFNNYNADTITALVDNGYRVMSSLTQIDPGPYPFEDDEEDIYHVSIGASTNDMWDGVSPVNWQLTFEQVQTQMQNFGFAAVMMHPQEFSNMINKVPQPDVNQTHINELKSLIAAVKNAGYKIVTLSGILVEMGVDISEDDDVTTGTQPATTGAQPITTGAVPVTTGSQPLTTGIISVTTGGQGGSPNTEVTTSSPQPTETTTKSVVDEDSSSNMIQINQFLFILSIVIIKLLI